MDRESKIYYVDPPLKTTKTKHHQAAKSHVPSSWTISNSLWLLWRGCK